MSSLQQIQKLAGTHRTRPATDVKKKWREIVKETRKFGEVIITNYSDPEVVLLSPEEYVKLKTDAAKNDPLEKLRAQWDEELAMLEEPGAGQKMRDVLMESTPEEFAEAANAARRKS